MRGEVKKRTKNELNDFYSNCFWQRRRGKGLLKQKITPRQTRKMAFETPFQVDNDHSKAAFIKAREKAVSTKGEIRGAKG